MNLRTLMFPLLVILAADIGHAADLYKCVKDGNTSYRDTPCEAGSNTTQLEAGRASSLLGCYASDISGFENGFQIKRAGSELVLEAGSGKDHLSLPMKTATSEELDNVGKAFHIKLIDGVSAQWTPGTPNQKPVGVYKGRDPGGKEVLFAFFFLANGLVTKSPCK